MNITSMDLIPVYCLLFVHLLLGLDPKSVLTKGPDCVQIYDVLHFHFRLVTRRCIVLETHKSVAHCSWIVREVYLGGNFDPTFYLWLDSSTGLCVSTLPLDEKQSKHIDWIRMLHCYHSTALMVLFSRLKLGQMPKQSEE